jgi:TPR repeat protein
MYASAQGVKQDISKAIEWWLNAAEQGDAKAQLSLGNTYRYGRAGKGDASLLMIIMFNMMGDLSKNINYAVKSPYLSVLLSTSPKGKKGRTVSIKDGASLANLAESIKGSVMIVVAE